MKDLKEMIRQIIRDDALYRRKDLPGDIDDPEDEHDKGDCACGCGTCASTEDYVTPKYALYSMIGDAIQMYDQMENDEFDDDEINELILSIAREFRSISH